MISYPMHERGKFCAFSEPPPHRRRAPEVTHKYDYSYFFYHYNILTTADDRIAVRARSTAIWPRGAVIQNLDLHLHAGWFLTRRDNELADAEST
jgi:hypothetical protein